MKGKQRVAVDAPEKALSLAKFKFSLTIWTCANQRSSVSGAARKLFRVFQPGRGQQGSREQGSLRFIPRKKRGVLSFCLVGCRSMLPGRPFLTSVQRCKRGTGRENVVKFIPAAMARLFLPAMIEMRATWPLRFLRTEFYV